MRQFIVSSLPDKNGIITIKGKDFRYLRQVLRVKIGDMINIRFADGTLQNTTVCNILENQKEIIENKEPLTQTKCDEIIRKNKITYLDNYSVFLASKWLDTIDDHVNLIQVSKRLKYNLDKFHFKQAIHHLFQNSK